MACPFFFPVERADDLALPHPGRLPLGAAWRGKCGVRIGEEHSPGVVELEGCNQGYGRVCQRVPQDRTCDAIRFGVLRESSSVVTLQYVMELEHRPAGQGTLEYDRALREWKSRHANPHTQRMAECFLQTYLEKKEGKNL